MLRWRVGLSMVETGILTCCRIAEALVIRIVMATWDEAAAVTNGPEERKGVDVQYTRQGVQSSCSPIRGAGRITYGTGRHASILSPRCSNPHTTTTTTHHAVPDTHLQPEGWKQDPSPDSSVQDPGDKIAGISKTPSKAVISGLECCVSHCPLSRILDGEGVRCWRRFLWLL